jgi:transcriptional regulator with XRE-family HTH domain
MKREIIIGRVKIGEAVKIARNAKGLTQGQLAEACGVDQPMISRIEKGSEDVSEKKLKLVCNWLDIGEVDTVLKNARLEHSADFKNHELD